MAWALSYRQNHLMRAKHEEVILHAESSEATPLAVVRSAGEYIMAPRFLHPITMIHMRSQPTLHRHF
jgi:hypothetical protein